MLLDLVIQKQMMVVIMVVLVVDRHMLKVQQDKEQLIKVKMVVMEYILFGVFHLVVEVVHLLLV